MEFYFTLSINDVRKHYWQDMPADLPVLLPASSWSPKLKPPKLPDHVTRRAADCGGFVATFKWGDYRYSPDQYVGWLESWRPQWAATMDYCCEPEVLGSEGVVAERQQRTSEMAYRFWRDYRDAAWTWVPTLQGWEVEDYQRHARELRPLILEMHRADRYGEFRVGVGTLCRRASVTMIHQVVRAVANEIPGVPLHLWGVKLGALRSRQGLPAEVVSVDSAAWSWSGRKPQRYERAVLGLKQRPYCWQVLLPRYRAKVEAALSTPKQPLLF